jgi:sulfite exporter TauE/SafE
VRWLVSTAQRMAMALRPVPRALSIGLLTALLPCGWLYLFAVVAAGTASPWRGAAVMAAFWLGSVPILVALGIGVQALAGTLGRRLPLVSAVVILLLGVSTLVLRMQTPAEAFIAPPPGGSLIEQVEALHDTTPPCCRHAK